MEQLKKLLAAFQGKEQKKTQPKTHEREMRELLRENLKTVAVDVFYHDDPLISLPPEERRAYLLYFNNLIKDEKLIHRLKFFINKQANITLKESVDGELDTAGVMKMDGTSIIVDDIKRLSAMYLKENIESAPLDPKEALRI